MNKVLVTTIYQDKEFLIGVTHKVNGWGSGAALDSAFSSTKWCSAAPATGPVVMKFSGGKYCWDGVDTAAEAAFICQIDGLNSIIIPMFKCEIVQHSPISLCRMPD